ncbi:tetratricopeptide repeat protein [Pontibacter sp. KCTC 32443]|uniref:tetratricopeptide repeat-containing sensor histidine kinase n=1 Tax=Pontibacter TaxID=323449 RepID=UPI00164D3147|nr:MULTISPECIES: tetratricopeptide repeat protein [Pontibacter]MBC5772499.1 tetratricopeptide repeat protein [Pontibacter sp. KCTC 32443]
MITLLLVRIFLLIIVPDSKAANAHVPTSHQKVAQHHKAEELNELSKAQWYSNPKQSVAYGKEAIQIASKLNDKPLLAQAYNNTGAGFYNLGDYNTAADYYYKAIKLREVLADTAGLSASYNNIGNIYNNQHNYKKALIYYNKALHLANKIHDPLSISRALNNIGIVHLRQKNFDTALTYFLRALPLKEKAKDLKGTVISLINIGDAYQKLGQYDQALHYLQRGLALTIETNNLHDRIYAFRGLAETYQGLKNSEKAIAFGLKSLNLAEKLHSKAEAKISAEVLHTIYSQTGNYEQAYRYLNQFVAYSDSINNEEITRQTTSLQVKYETAQKEKENLKLLAEHELHEQEIEHKTIIQYTTIGLLALALTVVVLIYRGNQRMKRMNKQLNVKNRKVSRYSENIKQQKNELAAQALILKDQKEELEKLNQLKDKLFSIVAHDLRGPLLSLKSLLQVLAMGKVTEDKFVYFAKQLENQQENTLWLVDNLLLWARSQMQGTCVKTNNISIKKLTEESIKVLELPAQRKGITLHNLADPELCALADTDMVMLVLRNLIANAIKFSNQDDIITIETELVENNMLQVAVRDTGTGISDENQARLFGLRSLTTLGTAKEKGSGLGLALCKDFIECNNGKIWVESSPGEGSTFKFTLPALVQTTVATPKLHTAELV